GRIVVVDDDPPVADVVGRYLVRDGHSVECVHDGYEALRRVAEEPPDLVVLDLMLPGMDGLEVCRRLRAKWPIPVVMLTALGDETDRLVGFETGADDYVTKPFRRRELALRVRSVLRRSRGAGLPDKLDLGAITDGNLVVDLSAHEVRADGKLIQLTSREYDLLVFLMRNPRKAFTREQLHTEVWAWTFGDTSTVTLPFLRRRPPFASGGWPKSPGPRRPGPGASWPCGASATGTSRRQRDSTGRRAQHVRWHCPVGPGVHIRCHPGVRAGDQRGRDRVAAGAR